MTQEEKELLLIDLSARLPYGVKVHFDNGSKNGRDFILDELSDLYIYWIEYFKPYLRPMSSMTEEERNEWASGSAKLTLDIFKKKVSGEMDIPDASDSAFSIDWLNKKMFAYRTINGKDMFELGIALQASKGMYK